MNGDSRVFRAWLLGLSLWLLAVVLSLKYGAVSDADFALIGQLRLPRVILAAAVGMGLSVVGAVLQVLFTNPLCEPYTLGISSGATVGAVIGISLGVDWMIAGLMGSAFAGSLVFTALLFLVSRRPGVSMMTLLLAGVMMSFLGSSGVALWMAIMDSNGIQSALFWLLGDLSRARLHGALLSLGLVTIGTFAILLFRRDLDSMLLGEEAARTLGVDVGRLRGRMILLTSLVIAVCVSSTGMIGFVGLVIPHFLRKFVGSLHGRLLPLCAVWGAVALTFADFLARVAARPYELPVGVVTSLVGAPLFLFVILRRRESA